MANSSVEIPNAESMQAEIATNSVSGKQYQVVNLADASGNDIVPLTDAQLRASPVEITGTVLIDSVATNQVSSSVQGTDNALTTHSIITGETTAGGGSYVNVKVAPSGALAVSVGDSALPSGAATEATLDAINDKLPTATSALPSPSTPSLPVRQAPQSYYDCSFSSVGSGLLTTDLVQIGSTGAGMAVSQSGGNLVVTSGTTANAEFVARSNVAFNGALTLKAAVTLSQRIANNNFFIELVDIVGDALTYNIVNATTVDVTKTAHGFTSQSVGQRMDLCALSSVGVPMEGVIASIPNADTIRFTVAGWPASGTGTLSLTGYNKIELNYTGTTATLVNFNTRRRGWQNTAATPTINTTASGHMPIVNVDNGVVSLGDKTLAAANAIVNRSAWDVNIPLPSSAMYLQIRVKNGTTNPASTTTFTLGMVRVEDYIPSQVQLVGTRVQSLQNSLPVAGAVTVSSGTVTTVSTVTAVASSTPVTPTAFLLNSAGTTNATAVKASAGTVWNIYASNVSAAFRYLKLYNLAVAPTVGTSTIALTLAIPPLSSGFLQLDGGSNGLRFTTGIALALTVNAADADTTAVNSGEVKVFINYT